MSDPDDVRYVRENYFLLEELCQRAGLPEASYVLNDGTKFYPGDYLQQQFTTEDFSACGLDAEDYAAFLDGTFGICLVSVSPANIARKSKLIEHIAQALAEPAPQDDAWCVALRTAVDELDVLERPFTKFDREYFGRPVSRDTYITEVRQTYPQAFRDEANIH
ncbi:MAG: hypothetical protein GIW97_07035 [Candidatus Eremiobacteraeota bacterium]|nr:hypothetical protein [Candidatus Eremiobacteraeota bacterium]